MIIGDRRDVLCETLALASLSKREKNDLKCQARICYKLPAERANVPTALWDLGDLVRALIEHDEGLDNETKRLVPLRRVYWPG